MELVILGAVLGAVLTWALSYFLPSRDSKKLVQVQEALARTEEARARTEEERAALERRLAQLAGFNWAGRVLNRAPEEQVLEVDANEEMAAVQLTYCAETGAGVANQTFQQPIRGRQIRIPISRNLLVEVQRVKYDRYTGNFNIGLKIRARVLGEYRDLIVPGHVHVQQVGNTSYL